MNRFELKKKLDILGIPEYYYNLNPQGYGRTDERLCLDKKSDNLWQVYYEERGNKTTLLNFSTEDEACTYILNRLL